jgi:hypothetical protein
MVGRWQTIFEPVLTFRFATPALQTFDQWWHKTGSAFRWSSAQRRKAASRTAGFGTRQIFRSFFKTTKTGEP